MSKRRWQPPPLNTTSESEPKKSKVRLDEQVVRRVLEVNPNLRDGRTTLQVKKALESGQSLGRSPERATPAPEGGRRAPLRESSSRQLGETLDFFLTREGRELASRFEELAARKRSLEDEERALQRDARQRLVDFIAMLDPAVLARHGQDALEPHRQLLNTIGLSSAELLSAVKGGQ